MVIKTEISSKKEELAENRVGDFSKLFHMVGEKMTYPGQRMVYLGDQGKGKLYRLTIKRFSHKETVKDFP